MMDERIRKMKQDRIEQLESRAYKALLTNKEKAKIWNMHNLWQSLSEEKKQAEKNKPRTNTKINKHHKIL